MLHCVTAAYFRTKFLLLSLLAARYFLVPFTNLQELSKLSFCLLLPTAQNSIWVAQVN
jgi:hypothetical protein